MSPPLTILAVDDDPRILASHVESLQRAGYTVVTAESAAAALEALATREPDLVLLDLHLPDLSGEELLGRIGDSHPGLPVVMVTVESDVQHVVGCMKAGAADYLAKPCRPEEVILRIERVLELRALRREVDVLRAAQEERSLHAIKGSSAALRRVLQTIRQVARMPDTTVLILGESGTGKNLVARTIHQLSPRRDRPYLTISCTAIPAQLLESELFGHERGAFTDARTAREGLLESANGGTVLLDEIGDLPLPLQSKLLHFLEERSIRRLGGNRDIHLDVRVLAATNKDLGQAVRERSFREDLYYRLQVVPIELPPLRERKDDIQELIAHFVAQACARLGQPLRPLAPGFHRRLLRHRWPGNIRELRNVIERAVILSTGRHIGEGAMAAELIPAAAEPRPAPPPNGQVVDSFRLPEKGLDLAELERTLVLQALRYTGGNHAAAGRLLRLSADQIRYRIKKYRLDPSQV